jgi:hypothetical protein
MGSIYRRFLAIVDKSLVKKTEQESIGVRSDTEREREREKRATTCVFFLKIGPIGCGYVNLLPSR